MTALPRTGPGGSRARWTGVTTVHTAPADHVTTGPTSMSDPATPEPVTPQAIDRREAAR